MRVLSDKEIQKLLFKLLFYVVHAKHHATISRNSGRPRLHIITYNMCIVNLHSRKLGSGPFFASVAVGGTECGVLIFSTLYIGDSKSFKLAADGTERSVVNTIVVRIHLGLKKSRYPHMPHLRN